MDEKFLLITKDRTPLLIAMLHVLCGNAHISFEGDLSNYDFSAIYGTISVETETLQRVTFLPRQDFIIAPLEKNTIQPILNQLMLSKDTWMDIIHIQIEKNGLIEFGAYDNFDPECVVSGSGISEIFLEKLVSEGVIHSFAPVGASQKK